MATLGQIVRQQRQKRDRHLAPAIEARSRSFHDWAVGGGFIADREPLNFTLWRFLEPVYRAIPDNPRDLDLTFQCASQTGKSVLLMLLTLWLGLRVRMQGTYFLPTQTKARKFSTDRFIRMVRDNKRIHAMMGDPNSPRLRRVIDEGAVHTRRIGWSIIAFSFMEGKVSTEGDPLDMLVFDEVQRMQLSLVETAQERVAASMLRVLARGSTANHEDADINYFYKRSTQQEFFTACACSDGVNLAAAWDPEAGPLCIDRGNGSTPSVPRNPFYVCPRCKTMLGPGGGPELEHGMRVQEGHYIELNPGARGVYGRPAIGFQWPQLLSPRQSAISIQSKWDERIDTKNFYNRVLGRPYTDPKTQPVTEAHCRAAQRDHLRWGPIAPREADGIFMGIDQMGFDNRAVIAARVGGAMRYLWLEVIQDANPWRRCGELMREFRPRVCAVEKNPNFNEAHRFANDFDGRVFLVDYGELENELVIWGDRPRDKVTVRETDDEARTKWTAKVDQYSMMSWALGRWAHGEVETPLAHGPRQRVKTAQGWQVLDLCEKMFWLHLQRVALVTTPIQGRERERRMRRHVEKIGIDPHFAYANMLMCVAWVRAYGSDRFLIDVQTGDAAMGQGKPPSSYGEQLRRITGRVLGETAPLLSLERGAAGEGTEPPMCGNCVNLEQKAGRAHCAVKNMYVTPQLEACAQHYQPRLSEDDE